MDISLFMCLLIAATSLDVAMSQRCATCHLVENPALTSGQQPIQGTVKFRQENGARPCAISLSVKGFDTSDKDREHGFHVHELSDMSNGCNSLGGHYNPGNKNHGGPTDTDRHVGDLGNIIENAKGEVSTTITDKIVSLYQPHSIVGRSIVVHAKRDDLGRGGNEESLKTGNAGSRLACCIIEETSCKTYGAQTNSASSTRMSFGIPAVLPLLYLVLRIA